MIIEDKVIMILIDVLRPEAELNSSTLLLGHLPEFDSMAIVSVMTAIEKEFNLLINDDEITAKIFESVRTLSNFVSKHVSLMEQMP